MLPVAAHPDAAPAEAARSDEPTTATTAHTASTQPLRKFNDTPAS
jgi:hypothetical protein